MLLSFDSLPVGIHQAIVSDIIEKIIEERAAVKEH